MSSNLTITHRPFRTPQLKRNQHQFQAHQKSAKAIDELPLQSRFQNWTQCLSDANPNATKSRYELRQSLRDDVSTICSTLKDEQAELRQEDVEEINEMLKEAIEEDMRLIERRRERKSYRHTYQQAPSKLHVWVGQPREIPQIVFKTAEDAKSSLIQEHSQTNINCLQGFLSELGLFYFSVESVLMFFDAETMNADSPPIFLGKLEKRTLEALYGIQVFTLGPPYFESKKNIMVMLHPYQAEMYLYDLKQGIHQVSDKKLDLKPMNFCFPLPEKKPNKLCLANNGYLYTTDNKGNILKIDFEDKFWRLQRKCLQTKAVKLSALTYLKNSTKSFANSINSFYRSVKNYSLSFFATKEAQSQLFFDSQREIIVIFIKQEVRKWQERSISQYLHIYDARNHELLYILKEGEFLSSKEEIACMRKLDLGLNSKCNFILLLKSGNRILLDLHSDRLKRRAQIKLPTSNPNQPQRKTNEIASFFIEETLMGQVIATSHSQFILFKQSAKESESITYVKVQSGNVCDIHHRKALPFGQRKRIFLQYDKSSSTKTQNLPQLSRQVYFAPHQLYYATDQIVQRIILLRPIDIFYSLFVYFSENIPGFNKKVKEVLPDLLPNNIISICCQILTDPQGKYYVSPEVQFAFEARNNLPRPWPWSSDQLEEHSFKKIDTKARLRLMDIMVDSAVNSGNFEKNQLQKTILNGILQYQGRLFRSIFITNINMLSSQTCKIISCVLQELRKFLFELQRYLKCDLGSYIGKGLRWVNKLWQVIMLAKDIPSLPVITLDQAIVEEADTFSAYIFHFIVQECRNEVVFDQIKKLMPCLISPEFAKIYHLYCQVSPMKDPQGILEICRQKQGLPDYFIDYLVKCKRIPQAVLLRGPKATPIVEEGEKVMSYKQKMKEFYSTRSSLYEKEQVLLMASMILDQQAEKSKTERKQDYQQIKSLKGQLKMQELIIQYYHSRVSAGKKEHWLANLGKFFQKDTEGQGQIIARLNTCLLQRSFLQEIIELLGCTLLKVMYTYYFQPALFEAVFYSLAEEIFEEHKQDPSQLCEAFKRELHFMLVRAKLAFSFEEITIILDAYLTLLMRCPSISHRISSETGMLDKGFFWMLTFPAEIGIDAGKLYSWALGRILQADREGDEFLYLCLCCAYLVRDYLPEKRKELVEVMEYEEERRVELKQVYALILI